MLRAGDTFPLTDFLLDKQNFPNMVYESSIKQYESLYDDESFPSLVNDLRGLAQCWGWRIQEQQV